VSERRAFSVAVFPRNQGRILLIHHHRLKTWLPPGGEIHEGETPLEAAKRELSEETGLSGSFSPVSEIAGTPEGLIGYEEHIAGSKGLHMNFVFACDVETDAVRPNNEFSEFVWTSDPAAHPCPLNVAQLGAVALSGGLEAVARRWLEAFNGRDLDRLLSLYAEDAIHTSPKLRVKDPPTNGRIRGQAALRAWWADSMQRLPGLQYKAKHLTASGDRVFMEYERVNPGEASYMVAEVLVVRSGRIVESYVYHG
jgi:8-oxo-dGTP pyrophosphatase MutT (NUDIX family)